MSFTRADRGYLYLLSVVGITIKDWSLLYRAYVPCVEMKVCILFEVSAEFFKNLSA